MKRPLIDALAAALRAAHAVLDHDTKPLNWTKAQEAARAALAHYDRIPMACTLPYVVETIYRVRLFCKDSVSYEQQEAWFERAFKISHAKYYKSVSLETTDGGPAHTGYITLVSPNQLAVMALADRLVKVARTYKIKLEER